MKRIFIIFLPLIVLFSYFLIKTYFKADDMEKVEKPFVVILLGPPGAGKGTHAVELSKKLGLPHISTGDLFRENLKNNTQLGQKAKAYMEKGNLVPDDVVLDMLFARVSKEDCKKGYILDGFPRTIAQAKALKGKLKDVDYIAINLQVEDEKLIERITNRIMCRSCGTPFHKIFLPPKEEGKCDKCGGELYQRDDDTEAVVKERLKVYHDQTEPLIEYYANEEKVLSNVDSRGAKDIVFNNLMDIIDKNIR